MDKVLHMCCEEVSLSTLVMGDGPTTDTPQDILTFFVY